MNTVNKRTTHVDRRVPWYTSLLVRVNFCKSYRHWLWSIGSLYKHTITIHDSFTFDKTTPQIPMECCYLCYCISSLILIVYAIKLYKCILYSVRIRNVNGLPITKNITQLKNCIAPGGYSDFNISTYGHKLEFMFRLGT